MPGRKRLMPVTAERRPEVAEKALEYIRRQKRAIGYQHVSAEFSITMDMATTIVQELVEAGKVRVVQERSQGHRKLFEIAPEYALPLDRPSRLALQLWSAMRGLKTFSPTDLAAHCTPDLEVGPHEASEYCQALMRADYLIVKRMAVPGRREAIYQLVNYTGPRPPRERRVRAIWDDNTREYVYIAGQTGGAK